VIFDRMQAISELCYDVPHPEIPVTGEMLEYPAQDAALNS